MTGLEGRRQCQALPIIRFGFGKGTFIMSCWHCEFIVDMGSKVTAQEAKILIAKHNIREW